MTAVALGALLALAAVPQQNDTDLDAVIRRATDYVTQYEAELGNLIGTEDYLQNSAWLDPNHNSQVAKRMQRRTASDFLIIQVGTEWAALRKVNRVDGSKAKETAPDFDEAFDNSPAANARLLQSMKSDSTQYNIGDIRRDINLPTFALHVLRKSEVSRFGFEKDGETRIDGVGTWVVKFQERMGRTLVMGSNGEMLFSNGRIWIEPETGRVLRTEFLVENPYAQWKITGRTLVKYEPGKRVDMLVPASMEERYDTAINTVDCRAFYSNFRPFEVDVKFEISLPQPQ